MQPLVTSLGAGEISLTTGLIWLLLALVVGAISGSLSAMKLGGADIGNQLALMIGSVFGPLAAVPGILVGLIILKLL